VRRRSRREGTIARFTDKILNVMSLLLVGVGIAVSATFFVGSPPPDAEAASADRVKARAGQPEIPVAGKVKEALEGQAQAERVVRRVPRGPENKMLRVTIPGMDKIKNSQIPYAASNDEAAFKKYAAVHLRGTGNPWDRVANVYIAGHRLGYPATDSWLAFWDLNALKEGDRIYVTDANGKRYTYRVFREFVVEPTQVSVLEPLEGRNVLTLQTCTLPDYSKRLIVQAEKVVQT
jgi:sortase A